LMKDDGSVLLGNGVSGLFLFLISVLLSRCMSVEGFGSFACNAASTPRLGVTGPGWAFGAGYAVYLADVAGAFFLKRSHRVRTAGLG
jgi:hypothetical protein